MSELAPATEQRELLRRLELDITRRLDGLLHGDYRGLVPGHGSEPGEAREYTPGDDVRRIDWNVTARLQVTHVRETIADRELETHILVDLSPSLDFGTAEREKRDLALLGAAGAAFLTARVGNRIGALLLRPDGMVSVPARHGRLHVLSILQRIVSSPRASAVGVELAEGIARLSQQAHRHGLAVVISDFLGPPGWELPLRRLGVRNEVLAIEVVDPRELELPHVGTLTLVDPETGREREVATGNARFRERYAREARAQRAAIAIAIRRAGADHLVLRTDRDWLIDLARFVALRRERNRVGPR